MKWKYGKYFTECHGEEIIKPNKMAYIKACGNNKPDECVMIGDDLILDIQGAQKAGLHTILVNSRKVTAPKGTIEVECAEDITLDLITNL